MTEKDGYSAVRIPSELAQELDALVGTHGFRSRAEIVKEAVRAYLRNFGKVEA